MDKQKKKAIDHLNERIIKPKFWLPIKILAGAIALLSLVLIFVPWLWRLFIVSSPMIQLAVIVSVLLAAFTWIKFKTR